MSLISLTLKLYGESLKEATKAFGRTAWAIVVLIAFWVVMTLVNYTLGTMMGVNPTAGFGGGLIAFAVSCVLTGSYLSMIEVGVNGQRVLRPGDLTNHAWQNWQLVMAVGFVFWIPTMLLQFTLPFHIFFALMLGAAVVFNPVPEMIYMDRYEGGLDILREALNFMQRNWPEWLVAFLLVSTPFLAFWSLLMGGFSVEVLAHTFRTFGPFFDFVEGGAGLSMYGIEAALSLILAPVVHFVMCFRGQLYKRLRHSNRRQREWQSKF